MALVNSSKSVEEGGQRGDMAEIAGTKLLLDVSEVGRILGLGRSHLYGYILRGDLRSLKLGRRRKISREALRDFIERMEEESA